jgi:hypothetical protein
MKKKKSIFYIISLLLIFGGVVRLFAGVSIFNVFGMNELWTDHAYFKYIYRVLGAFVILTGLILFTLAQNPEKYASVISMMKLGFLIVGVTMVVAGFHAGLPVVFYAPDILFCFGIAIYIHILKKFY